MEKMTKLNFANHTEIPYTIKIEGCTLAIDLTRIDRIQPANMAEIDSLNRSRWETLQKGEIGININVPSKNGFFEIKVMSNKDSGRNITTHGNPLTYQVEATYENYVFDIDLIVDPDKISNFIIRFNEETATEKFREALGL